MSILYKTTLCLLDIAIRPRYFWLILHQLEKVFELVVTEDNAKNPKNAIIQLM